MFKYRSIVHIKVPQVFRLVFFAGFLAVTSAGYAGGAQGGEQPCAGATAVDLNSSLRGDGFRGTRLWSDGDSRDESLFFKLEIPSAGILSVDVAVPGTATAEPKLGFVGLGCGVPEVAGGPVILERSATHLVLVAQDSGTHVFRVGSQDPLLPLGELKLSTAFVPDTSTGLFPRDGEDEGEIEIDPYPLVYASQGENRSLNSKLHELCQLGELDDHGDSFTCATLLSPGQHLAGEIRNGWGDDGDVFLFFLGSQKGAKMWTIAIETTGDVETFGGLYDRSGQRLEKSGGGGDGGNFRIVRTLGPGAYFVRVEGRDNTEGPYTLSVEASLW